MKNKHAQIYVNGRKSFMFTVGITEADIEDIFSTGKNKVVSITSLQLEGGSIRWDVITQPRQPRPKKIFGLFSFKKKEQEIVWKTQSLKPTRRSRQRL